MGYAERESLSWLREAVYYSAPITHLEGNRRYGDLLLTIKRNRLEDLAIFEPNCSECQDTKKFVVYEQCANCTGQCDMELCSGSTVREWPCQSCAIDKPEPVRDNRSMNRGKARRYHDSNKRRKRA